MKRPNPGLVVGLSLWLALAGAQTPTPSPTQRLTPNFRDAQITDLADMVGKATGIMFLPDPRVRATVNLINPRPMTPQELYQMFLSILQVNNFAAVHIGSPSSRTMKIVPADMVRTMANSSLTSANANTDEFVDAVIQPKNLNSTSLNVVLQRLIPTATSSIVSVTGTNALIITDRASNVARIMKIINELDAAGSGDVEMVPLKNSDATSVVRVLTTLIASNPADAASGTAPKVAADDRTNSVLVTGDAGARARVRNYIDGLDKAIVDNDNTEIRRLKYANVDDIVTTLKAQQSGVTAATGAPGATPAAAAAAAGPAADRSVTILSYKATNTLIVTAPQKTRRALMSIVDALDVERQQVLIEAVIADVTMDKSNDLGVNWGLFSQKDGKVVPGAMFNAPTGGQGTDIVSIAGAIDDPSSAQVIPGGLTAGFAKVLDGGLSWAAMIRAIATDANTNVVASPRQVTLDNQEVNLESGQNVPFLSGSYTSLGNAGAGGGAAGGGGGIGNPFTTVNRQDIGTKLKITPQLNGSDAMTLTIDLESSELAGQTGDAGSQITNKRTFHNVILAKDGQMIMIGGLIREGETTAETRVPFLGRIPVLGNLFKTRNAVRSKKNLVVFIRPTIIKSEDQVAQMTSEMEQLIREAQQEQKKEKQAPPMLPGQSSPVLPPMLPPASVAPQTSPVP